jgi:hypothetical protein
MDDKHKIENQMAEWLAHPNELGVAPKSVCHLRTYKPTIAGDGDVEVHLVEYEMPDGKKSRGFVNPPLTWSFIGDTSGFSDYELFVAYCGWAWIFPRLQAGTVLTKFASDGEEARYVAQKRAQGISDIRISSRYKIGTSEIYEIEGVRDGKPYKTAGNTEVESAFAAGSPRFMLPAIYSLLGSQVIKTLR